ncbi:MAG: glycosyltransferase family 1 protein [Candidatus Daviesbacteria bacterium]|nr:glycosyltransferase family 1 protein [Candidatus Daviesbacteria bacterium]
MKVGFDGSRAFVEKRTGTENYSFQLLNALSKIDKKNQYIVYVRNTSTTPYLSSNFLFKEIRWPMLWTQAGLALQTFRDKLDVLFVPAHTLPIIKKPGLKTVVTVHDLGSEYLPSMHQFKQRIYLSFMQRYQLNTATKIIAVSKATKDDLIRKIGINPKNVTVIYEGYNKDIFRHISSKGRSSFGRNILRQYDLKPGSYFLFVGTVQPRKNLERVIIASSYQLSAISLVIVGREGWLSDEIYKLPKKMGIEKKVKFLGYVPEKDLPALYSGAIALVSPSLFEGFGLPILEAQACGCPVVTSNLSSMPEVAGPPAGGGAILVNPYDVEDITRAMIRVKGKAERERLIKRGFENIKRFSWEKCARETVKILEDVSKQ